MKLSDIFKFKLFEGGDKANLKIVNENFEIAEKELAATNKEITDKVTEINDRITELNNLLGGKLDVTKIANNLVTTEEGYALDARMGKALSDMFLARAIPFTILDTRFSIEYGGIYRIANICFINILINITSEVPLNTNVDFIDGIPYSKISIGSVLNILDYTNDNNDGSYAIEYIGKIRCKFKRNNTRYLITGSYIIKED